jgi:hypothetical protein
LITEISKNDYVENSFLKSLLASLCQREEIVTPLRKRGARGDFHGSREAKWP